MSDYVECPECGGKYESIGHHWYHNPNHRLNFTDKQLEILTGVVMSDGWVKRYEDGNPSVCCKMVRRSYLDWLDKQLGILSTGVRLNTTAKQSADYMRRHGASEVVNDENFNDVYYIQTRSHPQLQRFDAWYSSGQKVWPDVDLTSTVFKHLYVGDGNLCKNRSIEICTTNEWDSRSKLRRMFDGSVLPSPDRYADASHKIVWNKSKSEEIFQLMGESVPGFRYKWID